MKFLLQWDNALSNTVEDATARTSQAMHDMELAWTLLSKLHIIDDDVALDGIDAEGSTVEERRQDLIKSVHFTQLEIAQRLRDAVRLNAAFIQLTSHQQQMNTDDLALAFTVAPVLGRWTDTRNLGDLIQEKQPSFIEVVSHICISRGVCGVWHHVMICGHVLSPLLCFVTLCPSSFVSFRLI